MSIAVNDRRNDYTGNNVTVQFAYDFRILAEDYLKVVVTDLAGVETVLTLDTDYTVAGVGSLGGGYIELVDANQAWLDAAQNGLKTGFKITINGQTPVTQTTDIRNQGPYYPSLHEDALDKLTMIAQELLATVRRAPLFRYATGVIDRVFPNPDPGKAIIWGPTGQLENTLVDINAIDAAITATQASAAAALASENAAELAETNAETAETNAAASAAAAAAFVGAHTRFVDYGSVLNADLTIPSNATYSFIRVNSPAASRTITLPPANAFAAGRHFTVWDQGANAGSFAIVVQRAGADTIEGSTSVSLSQANVMRTFVTDGVSRWSVNTLKQQEVGTTQIADNAITTAKITNNAITQAKRAALGQQISASSGTYSSTSSGTDLDVTNLSVTITTTGRPVWLGIIHDGSINTPIIGLNQNNPSNVTAAVTDTEFRFVRGTTVVARLQCSIGVGLSVANVDYVYSYWPPSSFQHIDIPSAGTYTYKVQVNFGATNSTFSCQRVQLVAFEL